MSKYFCYQEGDVNFLPSYCFSGKRSGFDKSKPPAWCDRIFFFQNINPNSKRIPIKTTSYRRIDERFTSSHKGVIGSYLISIRK